MIWLEAVLAFALLMLVFSTMVSVIVEAFLRIFMMREKGFRLMLGQIFDDAIKPHLKQQPSDTTMPTKGEFVETLTRNPALPVRKSGTTDTNNLWFRLWRLWAGIRSFLIWVAEWFVPRKTGNITVMEFAERLAATDVGKDIVRRSEEQIEDAVKHLAQKFENVGKAATEYYARRAGMISMIVAVAFAYAANIDAARLFRTLVSNQQITEGIITRSDEIQQNHLEQQTAIRQLLKEIEEKQNRTGETGEKDANAKSGTAPSLGELRTTAESLRGEITGLADQGLPIAWSVYPHCSFDTPDPKCKTYLDQLAGNHEEANNTDSPDSKCAIYLNQNKEVSKSNPPDQKCVAYFVELAGGLKIDVSDTPDPKCKESTGRPGPECEDYLVDLVSRVKSGTCVRDDETQKFGGDHESLAACMSSKATMLDALLFDLCEAMLWLISVLLAGLLIGLGGPFWYNMVTSLSRVVQLARAAGLARSAKPKEGEAETAEPAKTTEQPKNPVEAFKVAAAYDNSGPKLLAHW